MKKVKHYYRRLFVLLNVGLVLLLLAMNLGYNYYLEKNLLNAAAYTALAVLAIYLLAAAYYFLTSRRMWKWGLVFFVLVVLVIMMTTRRAIYDIFPQWGHELYESIERANLREYALIMIPRFFYYSLIAILLVLNYRMGMVILRKIQVEQDKAEEERKRTEAERNAWQMELRAYGAYMNPHFLFNELRDIKGELHGFRDPKAAHLARRIEGLESIAHYNATNVAEERRIVVVERELEQLQRYLHARHNENGTYPKTVLEIQGEPAGHKIVPMALVFLAENAYTHGNLRTAPLAIRIEHGDDALKAVFRNRIPAEKPKAQSLGSGLEITRRRLELAMPQRFSLVANEREGEFCVTLTIHQ